MASWWDRAPVSATEPVTNGASAALWDFRSDAPVEIWAEPDRSTHIIAIHTRCFDHETFYDGKLVHRNRTRPGSVNIVTAERAPRAVLPIGFGCLHLYLPDRLVQAAAFECGHNRRAELIDPAISFDPQLWRTGQALIFAMKNGGFATRLGFEGLTNAMAAHLLGHWSNLAGGVGGDVRRPQPLAPWQFNRIRDLLFARLSEEVSVEELAAEVRLSRFHFTRSFKAATGEPPHRFLIRIRIEKAQELLVTTDLSISEVAAQVGYSEPAYLARLFRREVGVTPTQYRRERRR